VASVDRRIEALEKLYQADSAQERTTADRGRKELVSRALAQTLDAMAHIRRAPVDEEPWRYEVEKLKDRGPFTIACYDAALANTKHPDEDEAGRFSRRSKPTAG
jgi:hypothetical protein